MPYVLFYTGPTLKMNGQISAAKKNMITCSEKVNK